MPCFEGLKWGLMVGRFLRDVFVLEPGALERAWFSGPESFGGDADGGSVPVFR